MNNLRVVRAAVYTNKLENPEYRKIWEKIRGLPQLTNVTMLTEDDYGVGPIEEWMLGFLRSEAKKATDDLDGWNLAEGLGQIATALREILGESDE